MTINAIEATIMYTTTKTANWLSNKDHAEKIQVMNDVLHRKSEYMKEISSRNQDLKEQNLKVIVC